MYLVFFSNSGFRSFLLGNVVGMAADGEESQCWEALMVFVLNLASQILMMDLVWRIEITGEMMMIAIISLVVTTLTAVVVGRSNLRSTQEVS